MSILPRQNHRRLGWFSAAIIVFVFSLPLIAKRFHEFFFMPILGVEPIWVLIAVLAGGVIYRVFMGLRKIQGRKVFEEPPQGIRMAGDERERKFGMAWFWMTAGLNVVVAIVITFRELTFPGSNPKANGDPLGLALSETFALTTGVSVVSGVLAYFTLKGSPRLLPKVLAGAFLATVASVAGTVMVFIGLALILIWGAISGGLFG